jgi:hypothetical protein
MNTLPDDLAYVVLSFCDLVSLWSYGAVNTKTSRLVFESDQTRKILDSLHTRFDQKLRTRLKCDARIRLNQHTSLRHQSDGIWRTRNGRVVSVERDLQIDHISHRLAIYSSFQSFLFKEPTIWSTRLLARAPYCNPVIHDDTVFFATSPTTFIKVSSSDLLETTHTLTGDTKLWTINLIRSSSRPSLLLTTSDGLLHFPNIVDDTNTFQSHVIYAAEWAQYALRPALVEWDKGGCLIAFAPAVTYGQGQPEFPRILRFQNNQVDSLGVIPFPWATSMALHKSGVLALSNEHGSHKSVQMWLINDSLNHTLLSINTNESVLTDRFLYFDFVKRSLIGITSSGKGIGWNLDDGRLIGRTKFVRRTIHGAFRSVILWPTRGSFVLMSGEGNSNSIYEWKIGVPFLDPDLNRLAMT